MNYTAGSATGYSGEARTPLLELYMKEVIITPLLTLDEETELGRKCVQGDEQAIEAMIKANLRLVVKIAGDFKNLGVPLLDLIGEGNVGLMRAARLFDPDKGKFSTYAAWPIRRCIYKAIKNQTRQIHLPENVLETCKRVKMIETFLSKEINREPTDQEIANELNIPLKAVSYARNLHNIEPCSLDAVYNFETTGNSLSLAEKLPDEKVVHPGQVIHDQNLKDIIDQAIIKLLPREQEIIKRRFGLGDNDEETLKEVGDLFGVSRERIRQLQSLVFRKLRRLLTEQGFKTYTATQ